MFEAQQSGGMTVAQYLSANAIDVTAVDSAHAEKLGLRAEIPAGWQAAPSEQFPGTTAVLVEPGMVANGFVPNAVLVVGKLSQRVDAHELLECSFTDARMMPGWVEDSARSEDLGSWPSRFIRGNFLAEQMELSVTTRYAVLDSRDEQYLVQLTVTVLADQIDKLAFDIAVINDGLLARTS